MKRLDRVQLNGADVVFREAIAQKPRTKMRQLVADLVSANKILHNQSVLDAFGHVSARHIGDPSRFLLSRSKAPISVTEKDIIEFDVEGNSVEPTKEPLYLERYIHSEIY